jgi:hypothetical protein
VRRNTLCRRKTGTLVLSLLAKYWADIAGKRFAALVERFVREQSVECR